ncbi:methyl-accepting chemotaxis protein [Sphaerotilus mobilis]|uniref:Methyl-accepting chemotaxis protein (MCP) signaling protein n=1 Tax=Sphaerotilus mobilis TaxID=47994 RepID=A0A4Q7LT70_9BURK|nr:methyl-accepting chemotaxis protein [Sphaerotilus mobilis]RZS56949.1 methyl-accepting chemotaxis protein (MCP) signaling protein [Sphaerotilus mobilis]
MVHPHQIIDASRRVGEIAEQKIAQIQKINRSTSYLALNALIEASRAGAAGDGFGVVAREVKQVSTQINELSRELAADLQSQITRLMQLGDQVMARLQDQQGQRLADLALNMIDIIDRNLYERSCDVRWWATDAAVVDALEQPGSATARHASKRLGVILDSYTVYLDLWVIDPLGRVVASGRPDRYPRVTGASVRGQSWFDRALHTRDGQGFIATDIETNPCLDEAPVATYSTAIRRGGAVDGEPIGVLAIFFDWQTQARAVVDGVKFDDEEKPRARALLLDARQRVIASSDGVGVLEEVVEIKRRGRTLGAYLEPDGTHIGYARTPGYETYKGLGWYGMVVLAPAPTDKGSSDAETAITAPAHLASAVRQDLVSGMQATRVAA